MNRLIQYLQRIANVILFALPGQYQKRKLQILQEMYQLSVQALRKTNEPFWLDFGTLLGQYRSNSIIPHDIDVDVAMMEKSYTKVCELKKEMPKGLRFYDTSHKHFGPKVFFSYKGFDFDIFFYEDEGETIRSFVEAKWPNERQHLPKNLVFPLEEIFFLNEKVYVPKNSQAYLELMYGYLGTGGWRDQESGLWYPPKK
ncbi:LicD family protein [Ekhidna sp.]|uniref:LicD family protein n=1 Tax=Ekhidna sp. TaxID=2608089 RepID=UPI003BACFE85